MSTRLPVRWVVTAQAQMPMHQRLYQRLAERFGRGVLLTGTPFPIEPDSPLEVVAGPPYDRRRVHHRVQSWLRFTAWATRRILATPGRPLLYSISNPPLMLNALWHLHRRCGNPYGVCVWDLFPDVLVGTGRARERGPMSRVWTAHNRRVFRDAAFVHTLGPGMAHAIRRQVRDPGLEVGLIPMWADTERLKPLPRADNPFAHELGLADKTIVLYSGNMGETHDLGTLGEAAHLLADLEQVHFVFIGDGLGKPALEAAVRRHQLSNVTLLPFQPVEQLPLSLSLGDISLVTQGHGVESFSVPGKTYSAMAVGSAVVALTTEDSDLATLVRESGCGQRVPIGDPVALASALRALIADPARLDAHRRAAARAARERYSEDAVVERFSMDLERVLGR